MFLRHLVPWPSADNDIQVKFYGDRPKYIDFGPIDRYISETVQDIGPKLALITNRKSHLSFRLLPNSVTLVTWNGVMTYRGSNFTEFGIFRDGLRKSGRIYINTFSSENVGQRI